MIGNLTEGEKVGSKNNVRFVKRHELLTAEDNTPITTYTSHKFETNFKISLN